MIEIVLEQMNNTAWMLDRKGNIINVSMHPLGSSDTDAADDAAWLFDNCTDNNMKNKCVDYIYSYYNDEYDENIGPEDTFIWEATEDHWSKELIEKVKDKFELDYYNISDLDKLSEEIKNYLNNNYLRCRYGGEFDTLSNNGELYFRISSNDGFNWYDVIMNFIVNFNRKLENITVETDYVTTGRKKVYWNHMPYDEVLNTKNSTVLENLIKKGN